MNGCTAGRAMLAALAALILTAPAAWAQMGLGGMMGSEAGMRVVRTGQIDETVFAAGGNVDVAADVTGDVIAAGGQVDVDSSVDGDVIAAGGSVQVGRDVTGYVVVAGGSVSLVGRVGGQVRAAGGSVEVAADIGGPLRAAGGFVEVVEGVQVSGDTALAGGEVRMGGILAGNLEIEAEEAVISGTVNGNVRIAADEVRLTPQARINGSLTYESPRPARIAEGAVVLGGTQHIETEAEGPPLWTLILGPLAAGLVLVLGLWIVGAVAAAVFPVLSRQVTENVAMRPWASLFLGFALLVTVPAAVLVLFITVLGAPLGVVVLMLYPLLLLAGYLTGAQFVGEAGAYLVGYRGRPPYGWRIVFLLVALVVLAFIGLIPWLGNLVLLVVSVLGIGAVGLRVAGLHQPAPLAPAGRRAV